MKIESSRIKLFSDNTTMKIDVNNINFKDITTSGGAITLL